MSKTLNYLDRPAPLSRNWWVQGAKTLALVSVITLLIFVWADIEFTDEREFRATVQLTTPANGDLLLLSEPTVDVTFRLSGAQASLLRFSEQLARNGHRLTYDMSQEAPGRRSLPMQHVVHRSAGRLMDHSGLDEAGINVVDVSPGGASVEIDRVRHVADVPVEFRYAGAELAGQPVSTPPRVSVRLAESRFDQLVARLGEPQNWRIETREVNLQTAAGDTIEAELISAIDGVPVQTEPRSVTVRYEIGARTRTETFPVTVHVMTPDSWTHDGTWRRYRLEGRDEFWRRQDIQVTGPREQIERLTAASIHAYIVLDEANKASIASYETLPVFLRFPPDMQVRLVGPRPTVQVRLVEQEQD